MSGTSEVMQEYLVSLGFKTDLISLRKFEDGLGSTGKKVFSFGASVAGVVAGVEAATAAFAYSMRKNFFAADLAGSTVQRMQAMTFAGKQFGISADAMEGSITNLARTLRNNPGMRGYAESLTHISTAGRDTTDVLLDLVRSTKNMPEFIGTNIMSQFGMGADEYHQMREHIDELTKARQKALDVQKATGVDMEKQRKDIEAYAATMDTLAFRFDSFTKKFMSWSLPATQKVTGFLDDIFEGLTVAMMTPDEKKEWAKQYRKQRQIDPEMKALDARIMGGEQVGNRSELPMPKATQAGTIGMFQSLGWSKEQASGILANLQAESQMNPAAQGDKDPVTGQYKAYGVAQWHSDRQADFAKWAGHDIHGSSLNEQLAFVNYELTKGKEQAAGVALRASLTPSRAGEAVSARALGFSGRGSLPRRNSGGRAKFITSPSGCW